MKNDLYSKLGKLSKITLVIYCITFFFTSFVISLGFSKYERDREQISADINDFNSALNYYGKDNVKKEQPLFDNSKSALDYAYETFFSTPKRELEVFGTMEINVNVTAIKVTVPVKIYQKVIYYEDGDIFVSQGIYQEGNTYVQNSVTQRLYRKDGTIYKRRSKSIIYDEATGIITPAEETKEFVFDRMDKYCIYAFNKDNISKEIGFDVRYNAYTGKVEGYSTSAKLNVITAVKGYAEQCQIEGELDTTPLFTNLDFYASLDAKGNIKSAVLYEEYTSKKTLMGITAPYKSSSKFQITFKTDFDEYSQQKPIINL